jgi:hypothetical protein
MRHAFERALDPGEFSECCGCGIIQGPGETVVDVHGLQFCGAKCAGVTPKKEALATPGPVDVYWIDGLKLSAPVRCF